MLGRIGGLRNGWLWMLLVCNGGWVDGYGGGWVTV